MAVVMETMIFDRLLDAVEGVAYVVSQDGTILAAGEPGWTRFAQENGWGSAAAAIGLNLYDFISGDEVVRSYRDFATSLCEGAKPGIQFVCHCDGPMVVRKMRVSMRPLALGGGAKAILYQCLVMSTAMRPPVTLFDRFKLGEGTAGLEPGRMVKICSYCNYIEPETSRGHRNQRWHTAAEYYRAGGSDDVLISHGICPACYRAIVLPEIAALEKHKLQSVKPNVQVE